MQFPLLHEFDFVAINFNACFSIHHLGQVFDNVSGLHSDVLEVFLLEVCVELDAVSDSLDNIPNDLYRCELSLRKKIDSRLHLWYGQLDSLCFSFFDLCISHLIITPETPVELSESSFLVFLSKLLDKRIDAPHVKVIDELNFLVNQIQETRLYHKVVTDF